MGVEVTFPKISIVTPSFNQGKYLEKTILSVLEQNYPNLEYIIIDGGSTDNSVDIIRKYEKQLSYWVSEKDRGQSHAINKGFERATGDIFGWLNSDDYFHPGAFKAAVTIFQANPGVGAVVGAGDMFFEETGETTLVEPFPVTMESLCRSVYGRFFMQPSCFFIKMAWDECGPLDETLHLAMDTDLWLSIAKKYSFATSNMNLSTSVVHSDAKTNARAAESYADGILVIVRHGNGAIAREQLVKLLKDLMKDREDYRKLIERHSELVGQNMQLLEINAQINNQWRDDVEMIRSTLSWKLTRPLRKLGDLFNRKDR